jgi:hypothetical protein
MTGNRHRRQSVEDPSEVKIRLTLLDDALYPLVSQFFLQHLDGIPLLRLGQTPLLVSRVLATPESGEPWAGCARFADIAAAASAAETSWTVQFATPTSFKSGDAELAGTSMPPCPSFPTGLHAGRFLPTSSRATSP